MPIVVMLIILTGSFKYTGGAPVISGFKTTDACRRAIPRVEKYYDNIEKTQCFSFPSQWEPDKVQNVLSFPGRTSLSRYSPVPQARLTQAGG